MHRAFNIPGNVWDKVPREPGDAIFKSKSDEIRNSLESFLNGKIVDGTKLTEHWFPTVKADVFVSHSHSDEVNARKCAGWLKNAFGIEPFIDSCVWGNAADLLKIIDKKYCKIPDSENFDYDRRNGSTSHVHMMLSAALGAMIDATECVMFIKSESSITSSESIEKTQSPWLFFELATMRIIRRKQPARQTEELAENFSRGIIKASEYYKAEYEVPLHELTPLNSTQLSNWLKAHQSDSYESKHPLDRLYEMFPKND